MKNIRAKLFSSLPILLIVFLGRLWSPLTVQAGPPAPLTFTITQPDGTTSFEARAWGDEHSNGLETVDGFTVLQDPNSNYWFYAEVDRVTGQLHVTDQIAGKDQPPISARGARPLIITEQANVAVQGPVGVSSVPILILQVQYANQPATSTGADWIETFFGTMNSVRDYFQEVSYNQFTVTPALETCGTQNDGLTNWMTLGTTHPNAGGPSIALAALSAADDCVDYAVFDQNGDNQITTNELLPMIIVAGYEGSYGGETALTPNVWGHQSSVNYHSVSDGVTVLLYGQFGEWHAATWDYPGHRATIGLMVHEIGHLLGWPDLYDNLPPGNPDSEGVGEWSLMSHGLWLGSTYLGDRPAHPSAWEKWYQGWLAPLQLQGTHLNHPISRVEDNKDNSVIQLIDNPYGVDWSFGDFSGTGEYFLVENRQRIGYDAQLPGCGLLIWHIDETVVENNWANSDENHKLVDLEEADGLTDLDNMINRGDAGDPFPGTNNNTVFNNISNPASKLYDNSPSGASITNISSGCADTKSATFIAPNTVQLSKSAGRQSVGVGQALSYTLSISNLSSATVTDIVLTDVVPPHTTLNTNSLSSDATYSGTAPGSTVTWIPEVDLAPDGSLTRTFTVTVDLGVTNGTNIVNTVYLSSSIRFDSSTATTIVAAPNLSVAITPDPDPIEATTTIITYTITVKNDGNGDATDVIITNTIPGSTSFIFGSASNGGDETAPGSGVITWPPTTVRVDSAITRTFQVAVSETIKNGDSLVNIISVDSAEGINLNGIEQVEIVGIRTIHLPIILKN